MLPGQGPYPYQPTTQFQMGKLLDAKRLMDKATWEDYPGANYSSWAKRTSQGGQG